jgi:hypothetical protein
MNGTNERKWCRLLNEGRTDVRIEVQTGSSFVFTEDLKVCVDVHVPGNRRFTIRELYEIFP